ncbi:GPI mannosyltransferase 1 subunit M, partial [Tremellales sp. Uapishka_1]
MPISVPRPTARQILILSHAIHVALIGYAEHVDSHPDRYGGLKYTDVDWRVITDGTDLIFHPRKSNQAQGWLTRLFDLPIGDPYNRPTFRYTPLLPLLVSPTLLHPFLGKYILMAVSLIVPLLSSQNPWIWTLNPFVININTRGSPEAVIALLVVALVFCLQREGRVWERRAAGMLALGISYKLFPVIYVSTIWTYLATVRGQGWFGWRVWRFGAWTAVWLAVINGSLWSIWGHPFLHHTFLHHLTRLDHRHNFSPYFYPIYLSLFPSSDPTSTLSTFLRHPLTSFLPQATIVLLSGFVLTRKAGLVFTMFIQTTLFVIFNKVCTSQYFIWFLPLLSPLLSQQRISPRKAGSMVGLWIAGQAIWLGTAYQLEFLAKDVYLVLWASGMLLFAISVWIVGELLDGWVAERKSASKRKVL